MTLTAATSPYEDGPVRRATGEAIRPGGLALTDHALRLCGLPPASRVLDVGCGAGRTVGHLLDRYDLDAVGIDPSSTLLAAGRARHPGIPVLRARAERLPLADRSLDAALLECVLSLTADTDHVLSELARVLRPGGRLVVSDLYAREAGGVAHLRRLPPASCLHGAVDPAELLDRLRASGFRLLVWEDHSPALTQLAARLLWEDGSTSRLWCPDVPAPDPVQLRSAIRHARPGYFLLIAENTGR